MSQRSKRVFKYIGIIAGLGVAGVGAVAVYFTRPAVQREYALEILRKQGIAAEISHLQAGLGGTVEFNGLSLKLPQGLVQCKTGSMEVAPFSLLRNQLVINSINISGLTIDLTQKASPSQDGHSSQPSTPKKPSDFSVFIGEAAVAGNIRTTENQDYSFSLKGRKIDSSRGGETFFTIRENHATQRTVDGNVSLSFGNPLREIPVTIDSILATQPLVGLQATVADPAGNVFSLFLESSPSNAGQKWRTSITPRGKNPILNSTGQITATGVINTELKLDFDSNTLGLLADTSKLPNTRFTGTASINKVPGKDCGIQFSFEGNIADFGKINPLLTTLPSLGFNLQGNISGTPQFLDIASFDCAIGPAGKASFARLKLTHPVKMEKQGEAWLLPANADDLIALTLNRLPLTLANAILSKDLETWRIENGSVSADLLLAADGTDSMRLRTKTPLQLENLAISNQGKPYLEKISGKIPLSFNINPNIWELDTKDADFRTGNRPLADITGKISAPRNKPASFDTTITIHSDALASQPAWSDILRSFAGQDWRANLVTSGTIAKGIIFENATLTAVQGENSPLLRSILLQPFDTANQQASEGRPLLRAEAENFPLALATPFAGGATLGGTASGTVNLTKNPGSIYVETTADTPVVLHSVSFTSKKGKPLLKNLHLESQAKVNASIGGTGAWSVDFSNGKVDAGDGRPLVGALAISWDDGLKSVSADLSGDPTRLLSQPLLGNFDQLESANLSLKGKFNSTGACDTKLSLENIRSKNSLNPISSITLATIGDLSLASPLLNIPIQLNGPTGLSDLHATVTNPSGKKWDIGIHGDNLHVGDIAQLVATFTPSSSTSDTTTPGADTNKPDTSPFWEKLPAEIELGIKKIITPSLLIENTTAYASITPETITLDKLDARIADGSITGDAKLNFNNKDPYDLSGQLSLTRLPFSNIISLFSATSTNCLDGHFDTKIQFSSLAPNHKKLVERLVVDLDFNSQNGRVRAFQMDNDLVRTTGNLADLAGGVADIVGGLTANPRTEKLSQPIRAFSKIQKYLSDFPYEQTSIQANRTATGDIKITKLFLQNDQLLIQGNGEINHRPGLTFGDSPLTLNAQLDAKSDLAVGLNDLKLIRGDVRADGYYPGPDFSLSGSFNSLQNSLLSTLLKSAQGLASQAGIKLNLQIPSATSSDNNEEQRKNPADRIIETGDNILRGFGI